MDNSATKRHNVLFSRNFRLVYLGALVSELGAILYSFSVGFYILDISGNNAFLQGLYLGICTVVLLLFTPAGGVFGDRFNRAHIMFLCDYVKGSIILLATAALVFFRNNDTHIIILFISGILGSAVSGIFSPAATSLLPDIVEEDLLQQANSYCSLKSALESILGVILAGILYARLPVYELFFIVGVCYMLSGASEMFIKYNHSRKDERLTLKLALYDMRDGLNYIKTQKALQMLMLAILFLNLFFSPLTGNFMPYFVKTDVAGAESYIFSDILSPEMWLSIFDVLVGISSFIASVILSTRPQSDKIGRKISARLCITAILMCSIVIGYWMLVLRSLSLNAFLIIFSTGSFIFGLLVTIVNIPLNTTIMRIVEKDKLSKVTSIISISSQGLVPLSSVLAGIVLQYGSSLMLLTICSSGFAFTALFITFNREIKNI